MLAFKEWAYIVDALGKGKQSIILRKGGIHEDTNSFELKGETFLLFPTKFHQAEKHIKSDWLPFLKEDKYFIEDKNQIVLPYYATVADMVKLSDENAVKKLAQWHAWSDEIINERFNRWDKNIVMLVVQVFELPKPIILDLIPAYDGCKSWIEIEGDFNLNGQLVQNKNII